MTVEGWGVEWVHVAVGVAPGWVLVGSEAALEWEGEWQCFPIASVS
jgi:hypothetical protein